MKKLTWMMIVFLYSITSSFTINRILFWASPEDQFIDVNRPEFGLSFIFAIPVSLLLGFLIMVLRKKMKPRLFLLIFLSISPIVTSFFWLHEWRNLYERSEVYVDDISYSETVLAIFGSEKQKSIGIKLYQQPRFQGSSFFSDRSLPNIRFKFIFDVKSIYIGRETSILGCTEIDYRGKCDILDKSQIIVDVNYSSFYLCGDNDTKCKR